MSLIATLIANPARANLSAQIVAEVQSMALAGSPYWLHEDTACDLVDWPTNAEESAIRDFLHKHKIDLVIQGSQNRRKKCLIADMDSTMIDQECIDELAAEIGIKDQVASITARAMNGEIEFEPALKERVALLAGLSVARMEDVIEHRITLASGGKTLLATMKAHGAYSALVSGGFTFFTSRVASMLGFDENHANTLLESNGKLTGRVAEPILGSDAKVENLKRIAVQQGLSHGDFIAVGDGANDLPMLQLAGTGVALHAKPTVAKAAKVRIDHGDLTALLYIQGYRSTEIKTG